MIMMDLMKLFAAQNRILNIEYRILNKFGSKFKTQNSRFKSLSSGFTLIELLVVIGILGILAAALVATIDPFEQLKKATDAKVENISVEFLNSNIRYFTTHNEMPWDSAGACQTAAGAADPAGTALDAISASCLNDLILDGELKASFTTATAALSAIYVSETANDITVCYMPGSKSKQRDANTQFSSTGGAGTTCKSAGGANNCYWCTR